MQKANIRTLLNQPIKEDSQKIKLYGFKKESINNIQLTNRILRKITFYKNGKYKVEDNYKITLRAIDGRAYEHYYQDDFLSLMWNGFIVPKTCEDIHVEYVSFDEPIPNTIAYLHHEGQVLAGTFDKIKVGDKVRIRSFSFVTSVTQIDYDRDFATVIWTDDEGNVHSETNSIDEYVKIV